MIKPAAVVPTIIAMRDSVTTSSAQSFVAVKGVQTQVSNIATQDATATQNIPAAAATIATDPVRQSNWLQRAFSNPKTLANDFYIFLMVLFGIAVILNVFIKIRVQYPRLIASGLAVIVISGLCIMLNQNIGLLHAAVL